MSPPCRPDLTLRTTLTSPFGRKVRMAAHVLGLGERVAIRHADTLDETDSLRQQNPLGKMPCLLLADGTVLFDSRVIVEFLDSLSDRAALIARGGGERYRMLTRAALCDGIADAALLMVYEGRFREPFQASERWLAHQRGKVLRALAAMELDPPDPARTDIVSISLACALGYLDWRRPVAWRDGHCGLVAWLDRFAACEPAFLATARPQQEAVS